MSSYRFVLCVARDVRQFEVNCASLKEVFDNFGSIFGIWPQYVDSIFISRRGRVGAADLVNAVDSAVGEVAKCNKHIDFLEGEKVNIDEAIELLKLKIEKLQGGA